MRLNDIKTLMPSLAVFRRNLNLLRNFDAEWYVQAYPDAAEHRLSPRMHFIRYGIVENRHPSNWYDPRKLPHYSLRKNKTRTKVPRELAKDGTQPAAYLNTLRECDVLWVFFNVATTNALSGGMLSINRFVDIAIECSADQPRTAVAVSGVPLTNTVVEYTKFDARLPMVHLAWIAQNTNPQKVKVFLPEVFSPAMLNTVLGADFYRLWFKKRADLEVIILNQNNELMPAPEAINPPALALTKSLKIATAHPRYCTEALAIEYGQPVKQLTPVLPEMAQRAAADRDRIFMLSPDILNDPHSGLTHEKVVADLRSLLPDFEFVTVQNMTLQEYLDLASRAMFSLTFGEGMDGYFIEPILSKGVSFAVYNDVFFPHQFVKAPTIAKSWPALLELIKEKAPLYLEDQGLYNKTSDLLQTLIDETYSRDISKKNFADLINGKVDHLPSAKSQRTELFDNIRGFLERERGFRFHNGKPGDKQVVATPDDLIVEHLGAEFYSVLYEIYERRDYDLNLDAETDYVLVDIGANVGVASLYLRNKYPNIKEIFAYEPLNSVAKIAKANFKANLAATPINLKQVGLSDMFVTKYLDYFPDWTTAFSTDDQSLDSFLRNDVDGSRAQAVKTEIEVVPACEELRMILENIGDRRIALKCDTQGSEFAVFRSLDSAGMFDRIDALVVETHFVVPDEVIQILERNGFDVDARCDHEQNVVYTIKASRRTVEV